MKKCCVCKKKTEFKQIDGKFTVENEGSYHSSIENVGLFYCIHCGTVRIEDWRIYE